MLLFTNFVLFISLLLRPQTALWIFVSFKHYWSVFTVTPFRRKVKSHISHILGQRSTAAVAPFLLAVLSIRPARRGCSASSENGKCRVCGGGLCATSQNFKGRLKQSNLNGWYIIKHYQINKSISSMTTLISLVLDWAQAWPRCCRKCWHKCKGIWEKY